MLLTIFHHAVKPCPFKAGIVQAVLGVALGGIERPGERLASGAMGEGVDGLEAETVFARGDEHQRHRQRSRLAVEVL